MSSLESFRIAVRKFGPFESAIARIWQSYQQTNAVTLTLEADALDLNPLYDTLLARGGLKDGTWDVAFLPTDWLPEAV
ncbi:MAG: sugar ABC transporter substrate-binding protein, partial [Chloroflexota bacterium]|nr:sugar ABC transporter substrate-binding protein [Chloroflexota bacterium]